MEGYRINYSFSNQVVLIICSGRGTGEAVSRAFAKYEAGRTGLPVKLLR